MQIGPGFLYKPLCIRPGSLQKSLKIGCRVPTKLVVNRARFPTKIPVSNIRKYKKYNEERACEHELCQEKIIVAVVRAGHVSTKASGIVVFYVKSM